MATRKSMNSLVMSAVGFFTLLLPAVAFPGKAYEAMIESGTTGVTTHVWNDGKGHTRSECIVAGGQKSVSIIDAEKRMVYAINDQMKAITQMPMTSPPPGEADSTIQWQSIGSKVIDGHPCQGKRGNSSGSVIELWTGDDTGCTVLLTSNGRVMQKLKSWAPLNPNSSLFSLPAGYKTVDMSAMMKGMQSGNFDPEAMKKMYQH